MGLPGADALGFTLSLASRASQKGISFGRDRYWRIDEEVMFIRFVCSEIDERSLKAAGLFCAASRLRDSDALPDYEFEAICEIGVWFDQYLASPFDYLPSHPRYARAICWFKNGAREHLARAWELIERQKYHGKQGIIQVTNRQADAGD